MANGKSTAFGVKHVFEGVVWQSRLIIVLAVVASLVTAMLTSFMAAGNVFNLAYGWLHQLFSGGSFLSTDTDFHATLVTQAIGGITDFLLSMLLFILAWGLYELFISKLGPSDALTPRSSNILVIRTLDDLKDRMVKVVMLILVVQFLDHATHSTLQDTTGFLFLGGGILMVALALYLSNRSDAESEKK
jgi:uncharacterized membrane protein YqhA